MDEIQRITIIDFNGIVSKHNFQRALLLKDYYLTLILYLIKDVDGIYFKGGTALNKIFLNHARLSDKLSEDNELKTNMLLPPQTTFYSSVIGHSYYCIFYSAKAYLVYKGVKLLSEQGQHQQVYFKFKQFVQKGVLQSELLEIYDDIKFKAEKLLEVLQEEKEKRKIFTYQTTPQANKPPAEDSMKNANFFI